MYKIGEFSILAKTTIKTLRYYEKEKLLMPSFIDLNGYRYFETNKLNDLIKIISLRQLGFTIKEIQEVINGQDIEKILKLKKITIENDIIDAKSKLLQINNLLEGKNMNYEVVKKELPDYTVYYKEGIVKEFSEIINFILSSADDCKKTNPNIKCVEPDYCYVSYLDGEYKERDLKIRYAQAVTKEGISNENIKFKKLQPIKAICIYHKGSYVGLREAYNFIMKYIEDNNYEIAEAPRERYIDGMWNKKNEEEWLTEIQVPIK
ncbi:MAG: MerR family transcriptional regulator [Bacilli bacterium]|nr:MerR family transcriptional regulator [Bacilli bacterium]